MSSQQAPTWAFTAEALDGIGDTHLPPGIHVRALPSPQLGVPATPLVVYRAVLTPDRIKRLSVGTGMTWIDSRGVTRTVPFDVTPDNPVIGYFPVADVIHAELLLAAAADGPGWPRRPEDGLIRPVLAIEPGRGFEVPQLGVPAIPPEAADTTRKQAAQASQVQAPLDTLMPKVQATAAALAAATPTLRFEALAPSAQGLAVLQSRSRAPYALATSPMPMVRVVGRGRVSGIRWLAASRFKDLKFGLWEVWSLPLDRPAPRYVPTPNALAESKARVDRAGVLRQPMYVAYGAAGPAAAPAAGGAAALARVAQVQVDLQRWLHRLLHDLSAAPWELQDVQAVTGHAGSEVKLPIEPFVLAGAVDPDVGHHLGFGDVDQKVQAGAGSLVLYRVRGLWRWAPDRWHKLQADAFAAAIRHKTEEVLQEFPELKKFDIAPREEGPFVDLHATAVALVGTPPDLPATPTFTATEDRGWLATPPPPDVRRALRLRASGFVPHAVAALAADDSRGRRTLHAFVGHGRPLVGQPLPAGTPLPLVVSRPVEATSPGEGRFEDRDVPAGAVNYRLAQGDWFGRWSGWTFRSAPPKARTAPMKPTLELFTQPPAIGVPMPTGALRGSVEIRIPVPRTADLPAGGAPLAQLVLDESFQGLPTTTVAYTLGALPSGATFDTHPPPAHDVLVIHRTGPELARSANTRLSYTARWVDALSLVSPNADPAARTITDPRPPAPPPVVTELRWTARPDVQGHARVDLDFASTPGTRYRVYGSNERLLLKALEGVHNAERAEILAASPGAPRAMKFREHKALFGWAHFESLTPEPIVASGTTTRFVHRVSGSLDVLVIYRVLAEGPSGALTEISETDLVPFAVPNLGPPAQPLVSVLNAGLDPTTAGVRLRVKVPRGKATPKAWRLRRASVPVNDPLRMNLVAQGMVTAPVVERDGTSFDIDVAEPLQPWRQYRFAVEVQAADPPGAPTLGTVLPGEWSPASATAQLAVIPPDPPAAPSSVTVANVASQLKVTLHHPAADRLVGTALGPHRFEAWRVEPGRRPQPRELLFRRGAADAWEAVDASGAAPAGSYVTVRVIDPMGRRSDATASNVLT